MPDAPPLLVAEVLSVDAPLTTVREKLEEYKAWGVRHVWLVDPHSQRMYTCDAALTQVQTLRVPELNLVITPADIFE